MKTVARTVLVLAVAALLAAPLAAADKDKKKRKKGKRGPRKTIVVRVPKSIVLTADQKSQVDAINKEYGPRLAEINKKRNGVITTEQRQARIKAVKDARAAGKKGKDLRAAVNAAFQMSAEQKEQLKEIGQQLKELRREVNQKYHAILTDEQKSKLKRPRKGKKAKKKAEKASADN